jgi:hypothetical protein
MGHHQRLARTLEGPADGQGVPDRGGQGLLYEQRLSRPGDGSGDLQVVARWKCQAYGLDGRVTNQVVPPPVVGAAEAGRISTADGLVPSGYGRQQRPTYVVCKVAGVSAAVMAKAYQSYGERSSHWLVRFLLVWEARPF